MRVGEWIQTLSLLGVVVALILGTLQLREVGRQSTALRDTLRQTAYEAMSMNHNEYRIAYLKDDPEMLRWHLESRGYPVSDVLGNKKTLYLLAKLDTHERSTLYNLDGLLPHDVWQGWLSVIKRDIDLPEFRLIWPNAKQFFAPTFVALIDELLAELPQAPAATSSS